MTEKILILGCGSIGQRHAKNLIDLGYNVVLYDPSKKALDETMGLKTEERTTDYWEALQSGCSIALICSPPQHHIQQAIDCLEVDMHVFIEKPLSHNLAGIKQMYALSKRKKLIVMVACNYRFIDSIKWAAKKVGKVYGCQISYGSYLPDWRKTDYTKGYAAKKETGGGVILDAGIHQIDLALGLFGNATLVASYAKKQSNLKIKTEDYADLILQHDKGVITTIHVDYLSRARKHTIRFVGSEGTISIDIPPSSEMYIKEIKHFLYCIEHKEKPIGDGWRALEIALEARP